MKTLQTVELIGSEQSRRTGWRLVPGFARAVLVGGESVFLGNVSPNAAVEIMESRGVDCTAYRERLAEACKPWEPPAEEKAATEFQDPAGGYSVPAALGKWEYSHTFGRWGRFVTFQDSAGPVFTYPRRATDTPAA